MARLIYSRAAMADMERLTDFLMQSDPVAAEDTVRLIEEAVGVLRNHPLIGRSAEADLRELIASRGQSGYVVLYRFDPAQDLVFLLAVRHQREAGYSGDA